MGSGLIASWREQGIDAASQLSVLNVSGNQLESKALKDVKRLGHLTVLNVSFNAITSLAECRLPASVKVRERLCRARSWSVPTVLCPLHVPTTAFIGTTICY